MAGSIASLYVTGSAFLQWQASKNDPTLGVVGSNSQLGITQIFQNQVGAAFRANQVYDLKLVVPASGTYTIDLSAAQTNVLTSNPSSMARIYAAAIWLPSTAQSATLGTAASAVTVGRAAVAPALLFGLTAGSAIKMRNGSINHWMTPSTTGYVLNASQRQLLLTNNDTANAANVMLILLGNDV